MTFRIQVKDLDGEDKTLGMNDYLRENHADERLSCRPDDIDTLKVSLAIILDQSYEHGGDEIESEMDRWRQDVDILDEESYFPITLGPTPDGLTIVVTKPRGRVVATVFAIDKHGVSSDALAEFDLPDAKQALEQTGDYILGLESVDVDEGRPDPATHSHYEVHVESV